MGYVICINNDHWFGTIGKKYKLIDIKLKTLKDIRYIGDCLYYEVNIVEDDKGQRVEIPSEFFELA